MGCEAWVLVANDFLWEAKPTEYIF
jgi:hypothetical protein